MVSLISVPRTMMRSLSRRMKNVVEHVRLWDCSMTVGQGGAASCRYPYITLGPPGGMCNSVVARVRRECAG